MLEATPCSDRGEVRWHPPFRDDQGSELPSQEDRFQRALRALRRVDRKKSLGKDRVVMERRDGGLGDGGLGREGRRGRLSRRGRDRLR